MAFHALMPLCVCWFLLQNVFLKFINIFVFFVFILVDAFGFLIFYFHPDREISENLFIKIIYYFLFFLLLTGKALIFAKYNFHAPFW